MFNPSHVKYSSLIIFKNYNLTSVIIANNSVLYIEIKHINIQHYYIQDEITSRRNNLVFIFLKFILANALTNLVKNIKFLNFINKI